MSYYSNRYAKEQSNQKRVTESLENFKMEKPKKKVFGNYRIVENSLVYQTNVTEEKRFSKNDIDLFLEWSKGKIKITQNHREEALTIDQAKKLIESNDWSVTLKGTSLESEEIARKIIRDGKTVLIGNSSILSLVGRTVSYGREQLNRSVTEIQKNMANDSDFNMIPFSVFDQAGLDLNKFQLIEKGAESTVKVKNIEKEWNGSKQVEKVTYENRHFTGASLFSVDGAFYLFDLDQREIKHNIFNPFLAKIEGQPKSIKEAYEVLKPKAVKDAEKKGLKVLRQGEWFFIETKAPKIKKLSKMEKLTALLAGRWSIDKTTAKLLGLNEKALTKAARKLMDEVPRPQQLRAGNSRPNNVTLLLKQGKNIFCSGVVSHTGREHADLKLNGWFLAVPNTSTANFTVTGDID